MANIIITGVYYIFTVAAFIAAAAGLHPALMYFALSGLEKISGHERERYANDGVCASNSRNEK